MAIDDKFLKCKNIYNEINKFLSNLIYDYVNDSGDL